MVSPVFLVTESSRLLILLSRARISNVPPRGNGTIRFLVPILFGQISTTCYFQSHNEAISKRNCCMLSKKKKLPDYFSTKLLYLKIRFHGLRKLFGELFAYVNAN